MSQNQDLAVQLAEKLNMDAEIVRAANLPQATLQEHFNTVSFRENEKWMNPTVGRVSLGAMIVGLVGGFMAKPGTPMGLFLLSFVGGYIGMMVGTTAASKNQAIARAIKDQALDNLMKARQDGKLAL